MDGAELGADVVDIGGKGAKVAGLESGSRSGEAGEGETGKGESAHVDDVDGENATSAEVACREVRGADEEKRRGDRGEEAAF